MDVLLAEICQKFWNDHFKNAKSYGYSFTVLALISIFSSIYRLVIINVTGQNEQSDTKVKTRLFRLRLEIQVKLKNESTGEIE